MKNSSFKGIKLVDRASYLLNLCRGKRVLHLGATDAPETENAINDGRYLHLKLAEVASHLVGMDNNMRMIEFLRYNYKIEDIHFGDIEIVDDYPDEPFDVIVVGEILEHLSNPGLALDALRSITSPGAIVVATVPNAYSLKGFLRAITGHEFIHPDHTLHHSQGTLKELLSRHGFEIEQSFSFVNGGDCVSAKVTNQILKLFPQLAEGIGVCCRPVSSSGLTAKNQ